MVELGRALAAELLGAAATDIAFEDGSYVISGTDPRIGLLEVARAAEDRAEPLAPAEAFETSGASHRSGCQLYEVEVDPDRGRIVIERHIMVADPGTVLNSPIVHGQLHGGIAQGIGQALLRHRARHAAHARARLAGAGGSPIAGARRGHRRLPYARLRLSPTIVGTLRSDHAALRLVAA